MSLRTYVKSEAKSKPVYENKVNINYAYLPKQPVTVWSLISGGLNDMRELVGTSTLAGILIPLIFIGIGGFILWQQIQPGIDQNLKQTAGFYDQGNVSLVADSYITEYTKYLSDPGADYFRQLTNNALKQNVLQIDPVSLNYQGVFYLSIPALHFNRLPVKANVESGVESVYNSVLTKYLAHFKNTGLPISDINNNMVIYGHSARDFYRASPNEALAAFTYLSDLKLGDEIFIDMDGKQYKYVMVKSKIVDPDDTEIITGTAGKRTLTLMTCYPRGVNSHRLVVIAKPVPNN